MDKIIIENINKYFNEKMTELINRDYLNYVEVDMHRKNFLEKFGPDKLKNMNDDDLLVSMSYNVNELEPMDYWLEFKDNDEFKSAYFGGIRGGSAAKYGVWQDKKSHKWRKSQLGSKLTQNVSQEEALSILKNRRKEILSTVSMLSEIYENQSIEEINPQKFNNSIKETAKDYSSNVWFHKYLHLVFPKMITWTAGLEHSRASLYRLGIIPSDNVYENDINCIKFWNKIDKLRELPAEFRYRCGAGLYPRNHWILEVDQKTANDMIDNRALALGPKQVGNILTAIMNQTSVSDKKNVIDSAFIEANLLLGDDAANLKHLILRIESGNIVTLIINSKRAIIGEVKGGSNYYFNENIDRPHCVDVDWYDLGEIEKSLATGTFKFGGRLTKLNSTNPILARLEKALIFCGGSPWDYNKKIPLKKSSEAKDIAMVLPEPTGITDQVFKMLERKKQVILYGPPGTGKTYHALRIAKEFIARENYKKLSSSIATDKSEEEHYEPYLKICTFHPAYSYEDFIEGYRPSEGGSFIKEDGVFKTIVNDAKTNKDKKFVLIIDEINRGNIPKIFGELITLIESTKRGKTKVTLPLSKTLFTVPNNLYIIGAMNTADRSILLLDTALRRRFAFKELMPDPKLLKKSINGKLDVELLSLSDWLRSLNERIVEHLGRDGRNLQIGHAYLMNSSGNPLVTIEEIGNAFRDEIWPLLQEYCYEDADKLQNILGNDLFDKNLKDLRHKLFEPGENDKLKQALEGIIKTQDDPQYSEENQVNDDVENNEN